MLPKTFFVQTVPLKILSYHSSDSSDYYSTGPKSNFPSNDKLKFFNNCNSLEVISNNKEDISPHMLINNFCDNFLIECSNKLALLGNTFILMGDFNIDLLKSHANNVTSKFLEVMTS